MIFALDIIAELEVKFVLSKLPIVEVTELILDTFRDDDEILVLIKFVFNNVPIVVVVEFKLLMFAEDAVILTPIKPPTVIFVTCPLKQMISDALIVPDDIFIFVKSVLIKLPVVIEIAFIFEVSREDAVMFVTFIPPEVNDVLTKFPIVALLPTISACNL